MGAAAIAPGSAGAAPASSTVTSSGAWCAPYGIELLIEDDSGNWWSVVQRRR